MPSFIAVIVAALAATAHGNPIPNPQDVTVIGVGTTSGDPNARTSLVCGLSATQSTTWENSGAEFFLNGELERNGAGNQRISPGKFSSL